MHAGYHAFAETLLQERQRAQLPPFHHLALLRAESSRPENAVQFLRLALAQAQRLHAPDGIISHLGPLPAMLEKRGEDRKSTRLNSSHVAISYAGFCWKRKTSYGTVIPRGHN